MEVHKFLVFFSRNSASSVFAKTEARFSDSLKKNVVGLVKSISVFHYYRNLDRHLRLVLSLLHIKGMFGKSFSIFSLLDFGSRTSSSSNIGGSLKATTRQHAIPSALTVKPIEAFIRRCRGTQSVL
uniref:Uncharacterized protein n=1 Tax=Solanum lycopersicum TaxID=4081 RepID=A0A3Q7IFX1_SOLLC